MSAGAPSPSLVAKSSSDDPAPCFRNGSKFSYTLEFLLSIRKSDGCQRLPSGLDSTILWESGLNEEPQQIPPPPLPFSSNSLKWDSNYVRSSLKSNPQSGILGKGVLLRAHCLPTFSNVPKTEETTSCHLLARSAAPYRPPHLYKPNLQPEIDDVGGKAFGTSEVNRAVKTEEERQKTSESLWKEWPAILDTEMNASAVLKENLDPSNRTCTSDCLKKYSTPVQESGNPEQIKNYDLKADQTTKLSSPGILPWFKEGTEGKSTDQNTELNKQQWTNACYRSNDGKREVKSSTYPSAAEEVFKQLHEWDKPTKEREDNSGISHDAGSHNLLHLLEESTCIESLVAAFCICDDEEEEDSSEDTATRLCFPEECQSTFDLPAEAEEPPLDINLRGAISTYSEMRLEISTEKGPPIILVANPSDEICWPDEDVVNGIYSEVGLQGSPRPVDFRVCGKTSNPTVVRNVEKKTPPTTPASKMAKSNSIVKKHTPPRVFPPYPSVPLFNNAIRTPALPPTPPSLYRMPPICPFPRNQMAPYSQFGLPPPHPFPFPHQMFGNLSAKRDLSAGDLGILNNMPFEEGKQLGGGHLGWPWFGDNA